MTIGLSDEGVLASPVALKTGRCSGRVVGTTAWLGIDNPPTGLNQLTMVDLSTKSQRTISFAELTPTDMEDFRQPAIYSVFRGAIVNDDLVYLGVGDLLVVGPR